MALTMKFTLLVVIFLILAVHMGEPAKKHKKTATYLKDGHHKDKMEKRMPQESKLETKARIDKRSWKTSQLDEKKQLGDVKDIKWKEQRRPDSKGKHQQGKKPEPVSSSLVDSRRINDKPKKLDDVKCTPMEKYKEENVVTDDKVIQNESPTQQLDESLDEEEDYPNEESVATLDSVKVCVDNKSEVKKPQNRAIKNKESILIQEDVDGKCYYEL
ncbi:uncharacterized protein LOC124160667 [Ischnura elegans]|uniref:uncharacterized protein LOC124160667 n=1 Tax=Ischnura elegans TaxID=197161 RepID=UPI001ED86732|nr:uncharacterized protein LOC124160667 [Ischnura elegans]